jgi:SAM-dependent methyltransferase
MGIDANEQLEYFSAVQYRDALHPVVLAYAAPKIDYVLRNTSLESRSTILDLACGNGVFTHHLKRISASTVGLDLSSHLLAQNPSGRRVCGDAVTLPFADDAFDLVFEANLLHHVPDREHVLREMRRVSRRYVAFVEPNWLNPIMFLFALAVPAERGLLKSSARSLMDLVRVSGLRPIFITTTGMISQNNTPAFLLPFLKRFDTQIWWGEYCVMVAEK